MPTPENIQPDPAKLPGRRAIQRYSRLRRYKKLRRKKHLKRSLKPIRRIRPKRRAELRKFRQLVMAKFDGLCIRCFVERGDRRAARDPHHWWPRGRRGGDNPENGLPVCRSCHVWIHTNQSEAITAGWICVDGQKNDRARWIEKVLRIGPG